MGVVSGWQTKFNVSPGPGFWPLVLGPFSPDLGPDLDLTWDLDLDLSLTTSSNVQCVALILARRLMLRITLKTSIFLGVLHTIANFVATLLTGGTSCINM